MNIVLNAILEIIPYELAVIMSLEPNNKLQIRFCSGVLCCEKLANKTISLTERPDIAAALNRGEVELIKETSNPDHHDTYEGLISMPTGHSCMLAPLKAGGEVIGLMTLDHRQCEMFTPERVKIARTLSELLAIALAQSLQTEKLLDEKEALLYERSAYTNETSLLEGGLVGTSPAWKQVLEKIRLVAPTDSHVLIIGETGTGKEQVAKAIHALSGRARQPFIPLNCSAINHNLAESELFGHEKGSFTGAIAARKGRFELADHGTLFLDELGDLPLETQPKLLRAIQQGTFERLGSEKICKSDVRIISATNANLEERVKTGKFREDLFYRLNVFPILVPPLRQRKSDIVLLAHHFSEKLQGRFGYRKVTVSPAAMGLLMDNHWTGNVRELENTIERALINCKGAQIEAHHIFFETNGSTAQGERMKTSNPVVEDFAEETRKIIFRALQASNGKIYGNEGAANLLKLKPSTLQSKMKKLGM